MAESRGVITVEMVGLEGFENYVIFRDGVGWWDGEGGWAKIPAQAFIFLGTEKWWAETVAETLRDSAYAKGASDD